MKNFKVLLTALAFVVAIGGVFASQFTSATAWLAVDDNGFPVDFSDQDHPDVADCIDVAVCDELGDEDCTAIIVGGGSTTYELRDINNVGLECGVILKKQTSDPIPVEL